MDLISEDGFKTNQSKCGVKNKYNKGRKYNSY